MQKIQTEGVQVTPERPGQSPTAYVWQSPFNVKRALCVETTGTLPFLLDEAESHPQ